MPVVLGVVWDECGVNGGGTKWGGRGSRNGDYTINPLIKSILPFFKYVLQTRYNLSANNIENIFQKKKKN